MFKIFNKLNITNIRSKHIESKILQMSDIYTKDEQINSVFAIFVHTQCYINIQHHHPKTLRPRDTWKKLNKLSNNNGWL